MLPVYNIQLEKVPCPKSHSHPGGTPDALQRGCPPKGLLAVPGRWGTASHLRPDQRLKAGFEVIDAAAIKLGHFLQELLVFGFKVLLHRPQLFAGLGKERGWGVRHLGKCPSLGQTCTEATPGQWTALL